MSVHKRGSRWAAKVSVTGTRKAKWLGTFDTKREALAAEGEAKARMLLDKPCHPPSDTLSFKQAIDGWKGDNYHRLRPLTRVDYDTSTQHILAFCGDLPLDKVTRVDALRFMTDFGKSHAPSHVHKVMLRFKAVMGWAVDMGYLDASPLTGIKIPSQAPLREHRVLSRDELHRLVQCTDPYWRPCVLTLAYLGVRRSECFGLTGGSLLSDGLLRVTHQLDPMSRELVPLKTKNATRSVPIPPFLVYVLEKHREQRPLTRQDLLFPTPSGTPIHASNFHRRVFAPAVKAAGLEPLTIHSLRHNWGSWAASFLPPADLANVMGHCSPAVSYRLYTKPLRQDDRRTAAMIQQTFGEPDLSTATRAVRSTHA